MFGAVNANQDQLIFDGQSGDVVAIDADILPPCEKFFYRKTARKVTHGALGVQFHKERRCGSNENILSWNLLGADRLDRYFRLVAGGNHQLGGAKNVFLANDKVEVTILTRAGVAVSA